MKRGRADGWPQSIDELNAAQSSNTRVEGYGLEVRSVLACLFCGAADFLTLKIMDLALKGDADYAVAGHCEECGRSAEVRVSHDGPSTLGGFVQTGGDDPPEWLTAVLPIRREEPTV